MDRWFQFLIFVLHWQAAISSTQSLNANHSCHYEQSLLLLKLKESFSIDESASQDCDDSSQPNYQKTMSWNRNTDCCKWNGVTCDKITGKVIELDLSCSQLSGIIHSNSSLFQLSELQRLNLAFNDFSLSSISHNFGRFMSLRYLNLSRSGFSGRVPAEISRLTKLVSLDLSTLFDEISIGPHSFRLLLQNLTSLSELFLAGIYISSVVPKNLSSSLTIIHLSDTNLQGKLPDDIFHLPNLQKLVLNNNPDLAGHLPSIRWNSSDSLQELDLSTTGFSGIIPDALGYLNVLTSLDLSGCKFRGSLPLSIGNLTHISILRLDSNSFSGSMPSAISSFEQLTLFDLSNNQFEGQIPNSFGNLKSLMDISLSHNRFSGPLPSSLINLTQLESIDFTNNSFTGPLPFLSAEFQNLKLLFLGENRFTGTIPSRLFALPSLQFLGLQSNQLVGQIHDFGHESFSYIDLSDNKLHGPIPKTLSKLVNLTTLDLSLNNFTGDLDIGTFSNFKMLRNLRLSFNSLSLITNNNSKATLPDSVGRLWLASCNIRELDFLKTSKHIGILDLSWNNIQGEVPDWAWSNWADTVFYLNLSHNLITHTSKHPLNNIVYFDLRSNLLQGPLPIPPLSTLFFFISNNQISGEIPQSLCNLTALQILELSNNSLTGVIPQCLGNMSKDLSVLDLHLNHLKGRIPTNFAKGNLLRSLNLRDNQLDGNIPRSLANCRHLEVLDLSNNNLNDTVPKWLGALPKLQVLSLRSNNLHGSINTSAKENLFSRLQIIDLTQNQLTGTLPETFFRNFKGMMEVDKRSRALNYIGDDFYKDSVIVVTKGMEIKLVRILSVFTTVDLSSNNFEGQIPDSIGTLISLRLLNLSQNSFTGLIPTSLGNLSVLESLDLSSNQLEGSIPEQLTVLGFLSVLNLSHNHLVGQIPRGPQFQTFQNESYIGNDGLCGFPLSKSCGDDIISGLKPPSLSGEEDDEDFVDGLSWKSGLIGYGVGIVLGFVIGCLMFLFGKPRWISRVVEELGRKIVKNRYRNKNYVHW